MRIRHLHRDGPIAQEPLRAVNPCHTQFFFDQQRGKASAVNKKVGFQAVTMAGDDRLNIAIFRHFNIGNMIKIMLDAACDRNLAEKIGELQSIHMVGIG